MPKPQPIPPQPGQESVWNYPRPPRLEPTNQLIRVIFNGHTIAETTAALRLLETSHPPTYYLPPQDIQMHLFTQTSQQSTCEWKGQAIYYTITLNGQTATNAAWAYPNPTAAFAPLQNHLAIYAHAMDACYVAGEKVTPQPGNFYGGWITNNIIGPFKGIPGSHGW